MRQSPILFVDLDNTLTRSDLLIESLLSLLRQDPLAIFLLPLWLFKGRAYLKHELAKRTSLPADQLIYDPMVLDYLQQQRAAGRSLVLTTASDEKFAQQVAQHLGLFDDVIASSAQRNIKGRQKLAAIQEYLQQSDRFDSEQNESEPLAFDYLADSHADLVIWEASQHALLACPQVGLTERLDKAKIEYEVISPRPSYKTYLQAMRPWQWIKNLLIFTPIILAKQLLDPASLAACVAAFISFCLIASAGYLLNDLFDMASDRQHPRKRKRPIAKGLIPLWDVVCLIVILLFAGLIIAASVNLDLMQLMLIYFLLVSAYTVELKEYALIDVILIGGFYASRIIAGGLAAQVDLSFWLLAYSVFIFLSLALLKRCTEIRSTEVKSEDKLPGRGYYKTDEPLLSAMGIASGYLSVIVIALYMNSEEVLKLYNSPQSLWLVCPLLLYWISRMWLKMQRNEMNDDPLVFAMRDKVSWISGILLALIMMLASMI